MKKRLGFVTNSSSSSFICEICGDITSGWDMDLSEAYMYTCENDHTMCDSHVDAFVPDEKKLHERFMKEARKKLENILDDEENNYHVMVYRYLSENNLTIDDFLKKDIKEIEDIFEYTFEWSPIEDDWLEDYQYVSIKTNNRYALIKEKCPICMHEEVTEKQLMDFALNKLNVTYDELKKLAIEALKE